MELWDEEDDFTGQNAQEERQWNRISEGFINDGYREGITAGKEGALQEGFDDGFASVGVPLGRRVGTLRGIAAGLAVFLGGRGIPSSHSSPNATQPSSEIVAEVTSIVQSLSKVQLIDIAPPDLAAEAHQREHEEAEQQQTQEPSDAVDDIDDISAAFSSLGTKDTAARRARRRAEALAELQELERRIGAVLQHLNIPIQLDAD